MGSYFRFSKEVYNVISYRKIASLLGLSLLASAVPLATMQGVSQASLAIAYSQYMWPKNTSGVATVYYLIDSASDPNAASKINSAITTFNTDFGPVKGVGGVIQWLPWTSADGPNYVDINLSASDTTGVCEALEGYLAIPAQPMTGSTNCTIGTILHEMGHVIGLWHEQNRADRATYITVNYANVIKGSWGNFQIQTDDVQILGPYDYASVMQYPPYSFSANGQAVIETIPAGMPLSSYEGVPALEGASGQPAEPAFDYSAGDKETILRLYGAAPTSITVTSNPVGLSVIVDGVTVTTPQTYAWPLYSVHTLNVPSEEVQSLSGYIVSSNPSVAATFYYTYAGWNNGGTESQTITVAPGPGAGTPPFPTTSPQIATYSANFVQLVPYTTVGVYPTTGSPGSASISPAPQTYSNSGGPTEFFVARQQATLTATANSGWSFYEFNNGPFWLQGGLGLNPKIFDVPDTGDPVDPVAEFSNTPIYTVNVTPETFSSGIYFTVDGGFYESPKNFSEMYDGSGWSSGNTHTLVFPTPEYPYSSNTRYSLSAWSSNVGSGGGITLPAASATYTATVVPQFAPATNFNYPPCGGTGSISPSSPTGDGFYPTNTPLSFSATPDSGSGWEFGGWTNDLTGIKNPAKLTPTGETLVFANFNIAAAPLALTSMKPATEKAGGKGFVLMLTGTGFAPGSHVSANGVYRAVTYVSSKSLKVSLLDTDIATPGAFQVFVENYPSGWDGCAVFGYQTFLVEGLGAPAAKLVFSPKAGKYKTPQDVAISGAAAGATIYYTTDGSTPTTSSSVYSGPISVGTSETLKADATATGYLRSAVATAKYTITMP
jgi:astacin (peptidase family M12A)/chitobiase/beta-hexosaminidase-like protein